jgi:peroxiredoxin
MRKIIIALTLIIVISGGAWAQRQDAIDFSATDMDGDKIQLSEYKGQVVILDFWATWCKPCVQEIPTLEDLNKTHRDDDFAIISISLDQNMDKAREFVSARNMDWIHLLNKEKNFELARIYSVRAIPDMFVIDKQGKIAARGYRGEALKKIIKDLLK